MAALQLYRQSAVGDTLSDALHEMVAEDKIPGDLATKVMAEVASLSSAPCCGSQQILLLPSPSALLQAPLHTPLAHLARGQCRHVEANAVLSSRDE